jgi:periplasmic divalent cation tolerance protein
MSEEMSESNIVLFYVTCRDEEEAKQIARALIGERLAACATFWTARTIYRWNGEVQDEPETLMLVKTVPSRELAVRKRIGELHSYEVPCIVNIAEGRANETYARWVHGEIAGANPLR